MARALLQVFIVATLVASILSFCCERESFFSCCGRGPCNIFCCNCAGDSCKDQSVCREIASWGSRKKRSLRNSGDDLAFSKFYSLDTNGDGGIDIEETIAYTAVLNPKYYNNETQHVRTRRSASMIEREFNAMDTNGNGKIEQEEFDESLRK